MHRVGIDFFILLSSQLSIVLNCIDTISDCGIDTIKKDRSTSDPASWKKQGGLEYPVDMELRKNRFLIPGGRLPRPYKTSTPVSLARVMESWPLLGWALKRQVLDSHGRGCNGILGWKVGVGERNIS